MVGGPRKCPQRWEAKCKGVWENSAISSQRTHAAVGLNPVLTSTRIGAREHGHTKLHSAPGVKRFGRHVAPDAHAAQSTGVATVSLCQPSCHRRMKGSHGAAADPETYHPRSLIKWPLWSLVKWLVSCQMVQTFRRLKNTIYAFIM